jgi:hypothetical protein
MPGAKLVTKWAIHSRKTPQTNVRIHPQHETIYPKWNETDKPDNFPEKLFHVEQFLRTLQGLRKSSPLSKCSTWNIRFDSQPQIVPRGTFFAS